MQVLHYLAPTSLTLSESQSVFFSVYNLLLLSYAFNETGKRW